MRLRNIVENKDFFTYTSVADNMWAEKIKEAQKEFGISFNTENNDSMDETKIIEIDDTEIACEMWSAGGDWESSLVYFKCQVRDGYVDGRSQYTSPHFVFIPNGKQGNNHLRKYDGKWVCPDADSQNEGDNRNEKECWSSLEKYLQELTKQLD